MQEIFRESKLILEGPSGRKYDDQHAVTFAYFHINIEVLVVHQFIHKGNLPNNFDKGGPWDYEPVRRFHEAHATIAEAIRRTVTLSDEWLELAPQQLLPDN